jgi:hypothetical protein
MFDVLNTAVSRFVLNLANALPSFIGGLLILVVGIIVANIVKRLVISLFSFMRLDRVFHNAKGVRSAEVKLWEEIVAEIIRWSLFFVFLIPALDLWGLSRATTVINQFILYLPNILVAVVIAFVGAIAANLLNDVVQRSTRSLGSTTANSIAVMTRGIILFFTALVVLNQLGVAQDLIRILFTGIVFMVTIAGGLAFGLGGKDLAREILMELKHKIVKSE